MVFFGHCKKLLLQHFVIIFSSGVVQVCPLPPQPQVSGCRFLPKKVLQSLNVALYKNELLTQAV